jgi:putative Mg2+ transporter-C (MgtC) family protein
MQGDALLVVFFQLALALVLGAIVGVERSIAGKEAGMRTFALVTIGSCLFVVVGELVAHSSPKELNFDPLRIASSVVTGIGFLGAGLIIFQHELKGLTTAAALWVAAAIGIAIGFKLYMLAVFTTFLTLFVFVVLWFLEHYIEKMIKKDKRW